MKLWRTLSISLVVALALLLAGQGSASALVEQLTLDELTAKADAILVGEVTDIASYQEAEGNIYTLVTLSVEQTIKGESGGEVVIKLPGGEVDGLGLWVEDVPSFQLGEKTVVFLEEVDNAFGVSGWYQGKFTVQDDRVVERDQSLTSFMADISQAMESQGITPNISIEPASMVLESLVESAAVEPAKAEEFQAGWQNIMTDGFEGAFPGVWNAYASGGYTNAYWGKDGYRSYGGSYSAFCAKSGPAGVNPPANYLNNMDAWMVYGPFSLVGATDAELNFYRWVKTELYYDYFYYNMASIDGVNFYGWRMSGGTGGWQYVSFDLTNVYPLGNLTGQPQVWIAFIFTSDSFTTNKGAFVDDVVLRKYVADGEAPQITSISPPSGSAGTGFQVTITGTNFGATQDSSTVTFWRRGSTYVEAPIVSWSDTQIVSEVPSGASSGDASNGVRVTTADGISNDFPFTVTFSYSGQKWFGANPMGEKYLINPNTADTTGEWQAVIDAAQAWNDVDSANFYFEYGGTTTATDSSQNGYNEIMWVNYDTGSIATATRWYWVASGEIVETDIVFNDLNYNWYANGTPSGSQMDVQNIATHELGHWLALLDLYGTADSEKTMYGYGANGETKLRTLEADDIAGIRWIYPGLTTPPIVSTNNASNITTNSATFNGTLDDLGTDSTVFVSFEYGLTTAYGNETTAVAKTSTGAFSFSLTGLLPNTTYHFRAKAVGDGTSYGLDKGFTTLPPVVPPATIATRTLPASVGAGANFDVGIDASGSGQMGQVAETLPAGFSYVSCASTAVFVTQVGNLVKFSFMGDGVSFDYTVAASTIEGTYSFAGVVKDEDMTEYTIGGDSTITVSFFDPWDYDLDEDGVISKTEALTAVVDYFGGLITKEQALEVIVLYFAA